MDSRKITDPLNRGMVGGLLGMPADMLNMLRNGGRSIGNLANRLAGVNAPPATMVENPVYGQEWWGDKMQKAGYVSPNRNKLAEFGAGLLDPGSVMTDVPMLAKGLFGLGDPATTKMLGGLLGATVWHGSPHKFDKFDSSKIGTGEGRQQQGIGSYLAEAKGVAQKYADKESWKLGMESGYLYKVDVPDSMISSMANHDLPLSAQPANVRSAVMSILDADTKKALRDYHGWNDPLDAPFAAVLDALEIAKGNNRAAASESLRRAGIPGIRYLDGDSRGTGQGSSNFVVFPGNENRLKILERNGQPLK